MADVTLTLNEYLNLLEAVRELPVIHKRLRHMQDQIDAQRGMILEVSNKCQDIITAPKDNGDQNSIRMRSSGQ